MADSILYILRTSTKVKLGNCYLSGTVFTFDIFLCNFLFLFLQHYALKVRHVLKFLHDKSIYRIIQDKSIHATKSDQVDADMVALVHETVDWKSCWPMLHIEGSKTTVLHGRQRLPHYVIPHSPRS